MSSVTKGSLCVSFGDTVRLKDSRIGKVRFIGYTTTKKAVYYGIYLKQPDGNNNGSMHNRRFFKCPPNHGTFVLKSFITEIIKKHKISASFHYNQQVSVNNFGVGMIKYIGCTHFGHDYWYGIELQSSLQNTEMSTDLSNKQHIHLLSNSDYNNFWYFDYSENRSIFVRQTQIKSKTKSVHFDQKIKPSKIKFQIEEKHEYDDEYINERLLSMMNSLNISKKQRKQMFAMDNSNKLLLIQQWNVTSNSKEYRLLHGPINNIKKKKKSRTRSMIFMKKKNKSKMKMKTHAYTPTPSMSGLISPEQSVVENLDFGGCDISKMKRSNKQKKSLKIKSKRKKSKSKSLALLNLARNKMNMKQFSSTQTEIKLKTSAESSVKIEPQKIKKSQSLELKDVDLHVDSSVDKKSQKMVKRKSLKAKHVKNQHKSKSKSIEFVNVKKTKHIKTYKKRQRNHCKSDVLLMTKSEKYKLKSKKNESNSKKLNKKSVKSKRKKKELCDVQMKRSKSKSKRSGSAALMTIKRKRKNVKKGAKKKKKSTKSLKVKSKKTKYKSVNLDVFLFDYMFFYIQHHVFLHFVFYYWLRKAL